LIDQIAQNCLFGGKVCNHSCNQPEYADNGFMVKAAGLQVMETITTTQTIGHDRGAPEDIRCTNGR